MSSKFEHHFCHVIMGGMASQITSLTIVYSTVHSGADQRKHQSSASLAFVRGIHWWPENSPHKWPVTRKMFPSDDVIMMPQCVTVWIHLINAVTYIVHHTYSLSKSRLPDHRIIKIDARYNEFASTSKEIRAKLIYNRLVWHLKTRES